LFVALDPSQQRFAADKFASAEAEGGYGLASAHAARDRIANMRFRTVKDFGDLRHRQQIRAHAVEVHIGETVLLSLIRVRRAS